MPSTHYHSKAPQFIVFLAVTALIASPVFAQSIATPSAQDNWKVQVTDDAEPGTPLVVTGTVYAKDKQTPLSGIKIEIHHTGADGLYAPRSEPRGTVRLKATMVTNDNGQYQFTTIRPGSYPSGDAPAHIHYKLSGPGIPDDAWYALEFQDDPHVPRRRRDTEMARGRFTAVVATESNSDGTLRAEFNILTTVTPSEQ